MENILQAFKDLAKFKIVSSIDTGDKTYDNLITLFVMSVFALGCSTESIKYLYLTLTAYYYKDLKNIDTAKYLSVKLEKCSYEFIPVKRDILIKLIIYMKDHCCHLYKLENVYVDQNSGQLVIVSGSGATATELAYLSAGAMYVRVKDLLYNLTICPIFISRFGAVGLKGVTSGQTHFLYFCYESRRALDEFTKSLNKISHENAENKSVTTQNLQMGLYYLEQDMVVQSGIYPIYPDRSFDNIVSRHKKPLMSHLECFQNANNGKTMFNGFGTYNLGIMIYGLPGTGKTSFMKAICNHLGRDGHLFDMRTVRTASQFKRMFQEVEKRVFIFDEFDCIQGVINRENTEETENDHEKCKKELKDRLLYLLTIQHKESKETQTSQKK